MAETASAPKETETTAKQETTGPQAAKPGASVTPFDALRREVDRLFEDFRAGDWRWPFRRPGAEVEMAWPRAGGWGLTPAIDLVEKDERFEITAELPGMEENSVEVKVAGNMLTIRGEKREEKEEKDKQYHLSERRYGSFQRTFQIPAGVDVDGIDASFAKGVLTVSLPKSPEARRAEKKIEVRKA
jgi:HSP20 family protein